jgi:hypothetical protein
MLFYLLSEWPPSRASFVGVVLMILPTLASFFILDRPGIRGRFVERPHSRMQFSLTQFKNFCYILGTILILLSLIAQVNLFRITSSNLIWLILRTAFLSFCYLSGIAFLCWITGMIIAHKLSSR